MQLKSAIVVLACVLMISACQPSNPEHMVGVGRDDSGALYLVTADCEGGSVSRVTLTGGVGSFQSDSDPVLWDVRFPGKPGLAQLSFGATPTGGVVVVALDDVPKYKTLVIRVLLADGIGGDNMAFNQSEIRPGKIQIGQKVVNESEFLKARNCPNKK